MRTHPVVATLLLTVLLSACSLLEPPEPKIDRALSVTPGTITVEPGNSLDLLAKLVPEDANAFEWLAEGGSLTADGAGAVYVAPCQPGEYRVTVSVPAHGLTATTKITVAENSVPTVTLSPSWPDREIPTGTSFEIGVAVTGADPTELAWVTDGGRVEVDDDHVVYTAPHEAGQYTITASLPASACGQGAVEVGMQVEVPGAILEPFTLAVIPDTQTLVLDGDTQALVEGVGEWLVDNVESRNIAFVTHVGDVVWGENWRATVTPDAQWTAAAAGLDLLDGVVPYSVSLGDHEYEKEEDKASSTEGYHSRFGPPRYKEYDWYGGAHEDGLSHYQIFEAGGRTFLHLNLEWEPIGPATDSDTPLGWARSVLEDHPELPTLITTHAYLWDEEGAEGHFPDGEREGINSSTGQTHYTTSGEGIFKALVEPFEQVLMVFNGHYHKAKSSPSRGEYHQVSTNDAGLPVFEMLANYQWMSYDDDPDWIRLIRFVPGSSLPGAEPQLDRIEVSTYSPSRDSYREGASSSFVFEVDLAGRFTFEQQSP